MTFLQRWSIFDHLQTHAVNKTLVKNIEDDFKKEEDMLANVRPTQCTTRIPCGHHVKRIVYICNDGCPLKFANEQIAYFNIVRSFCVALTKNLINTPPYIYMCVLFLCDYSCLEKSIRIIVDTL